jgi:hypothetical protein
MFEWAQFVQPLDPSVVAMSAVLGMVMGYVVSATGDHYFRAGHAFWQLAGGVVFFVPLSLLRSFQGSLVWERLLATLVLWSVFVVGMSAGSYLARRIRS